MPEEQEDAASRAEVSRNAQTTLDARQQAEVELASAKSALEEKARELAQSLALTRVTLQSIGDAVITTDDRGSVTSLNPVAEQLTGWTHQEARGRGLEEIFRIVNERTGQPVENPALRALAEGIIVGLANHTILIARDGTRRAIDDSAAPIRDEQGRVLGSVLIFRDITQRRLDEAKLRDSESQLRMVANHAPVLIARCDRQGRYRYVNQRFAERFGLTPEEVVDRSIAELLGPEAYEIIRPHIEAVLAGESVEFEAEINFRQFGRRYMRCAYEPVRDTDRQVVGWVAVISDITDRRQAEQIKIQLAAIVESSQDVIVSKSLDGQILSWNAAAEHLFGYTAAEAVGQSITIIIPPDLRDEEGVIIEQLRRGERIEHYETVRLAKSGRRIDVSLSISPMRDAAGQIIGASKIARDISARKHTERSIRFLADASAALAELTDDAETLRRIAARAVPDFADWCAIDMLDEEGATRRLAIQHLDPGKIDLVGRLQARYPASPKDPRGSGKVLRTGESEWVAVISDAMLVEAARDAEHLSLIRGLGLRSYICVALKSRGRILGAMTFVMSESGRAYDRDDLRIVEDLANRAAVALENARLLETLREADRRKDEFLATLAHELRNPLAPVSNALQVMRLSADLGPVSVELCDVMERQIRHLIRLVDDLMEVSRISRGKIELRRKPLELSAVIDTAVEISRSLIDEAGHTLSVQVDPRPMVVDADQVRLSQVVTNLLTNAAKYTPPGGRIEVVAARGNGEAVIRVRDTGYGIPREMLPRVFDMFVQMEHTRKRVHGGLGIGLALSKKLVEMHGGRIEVQSAGLDQGSQFTIHLPLTDQLATPLPIDSGTTSDPPLPRRKVLVVDDTRAALFVLEKLLAALGQHVQAVSSADAALEAARRDPPDLVISDIGMPGIDGYEFARRLRREPVLRSVPLVALTGYGQANDRQRALAAGFDHHLVKPVGVDDLKRLLRECGPRGA